MEKHAKATPTNKESFDNPTPILKWAGGKRALLNKILPMIPEFSGTYFEPFLGAGAVFFSMSRNKRKVGNDYNSDLIELYRVVRDNPVELLSNLRKHRNEKDYFYEVRGWDREPDFKERTAEERAARLIFLNKTCFNGLYRVNSRNEFNVPFGNFKNPDFISERNIMRMSAFLRSRHNGKRMVALKSGNYSAVLEKAGPTDFVYLDPPYDPVSDTSSFVSYQTMGFTAADQDSLRLEIEKLTARGVPVLLSNSATPFIKDLYRDRELFRINRVTVNRAIGASASSRGSTTELLIDNFRASLGNN